MFGGAPHGKSVNILPSLVPTAFLVMDTFLVVEGQGQDFAYFLKSAVTIYL